MSWYMCACVRVCVCEWEHVRGSMELPAVFACLEWTSIIIIKALQNSEAGSRPPPLSGERLETL